jgi:hypothetical protein
VEDEISGEPRAPGGSGSMDGDLGFWVYVILYVLVIRRDRLAQSETARSSHAIMVIDVTGSVPVQRHRGSRDTHTGHTGRTGAHVLASSRPTRITQTNLTTIPTHQRTHTHDRARRPKPRPTQQPQPRSRPLPAADSAEAAPSEPDPYPTLPPPAPRAPPRACSKAVGEMKARAADA